MAASPNLLTSRSSGKLRRQSMQSHSHRLERLFQRVSCPRIEGISHMFCVQNMLIRSPGGPGGRVRWLGRSSDWPLLFVCAFLPAGLVFRLWGMSGYEPLLHVNPSATSISDIWKQTNPDRSLLAPVSCDDLLESNVTEPNGHRMFLRYTDTKPHFWISLHEQHYDPVRWQTMQYGKYYEQKMVRTLLNE
jgi:hypothetical protein